MKIDLELISLLLIFLLGVLAQATHSSTPIAQISSKQIDIISQSGIDVNISYNFTEINSTHWNASFCVQPDTQFTPASYPLQNLTPNIGFETPLQIRFNATSQCGWFYLIFPNGFMIGEMAKFGENSTIINTTTQNRLSSYYSPRTNFYVNGRHWAVYGTGTTVNISNSTDATAWAVPTILSSTFTSGSSQLSAPVWLDGNNLSYAYEPQQFWNFGVYYRTGSANSDGTITWMAAEQTVIPAEATRLFRVNNIITDTSGYPLFIYINNTNGGNQLPYVMKSSTKDGTWTTATGFPFQLSSTNGNWYGSQLVPLTSNKALAVYSVDGGIIRARSFDGSSTWNAEATTTGDYTTSRSTWVSCVANLTGDIVHCAWMNSTTNQIVDAIYNYTTNAWGNYVVVNLSGSDSRPTLSIDSATGDIYCFWHKLVLPSNYNIYYKKFTYATQTWDANPTLFSTEIKLIGGLSNDLTLIASYNVTDNIIGLEFVNGTSSPFNVLYSYLNLRPKYSENSTNSTYADTPVSHNLRWTSSRSLSGYIFSFCNGTYPEQTYNITSSDQEGNTKRFNTTITSSTSQSEKMTEDFTTITEWTSGSGNWTQQTSSTYCTDDANDKCFMSNTDDTDTYYSLANIDTSNCDSGSLWVAGNDYDLNNDNNEDLDLKVSSNGGSSWTSIENIDVGSRADGKGKFNQTLSDTYITAQFRVGFGTTGTDSGEYWYIDDVIVGCKVTTITEKSEQNSTWVEYTGIGGNNYDSVQKVKVIITIDTYNPSASNSTYHNNIRPDMEIGVWDGSKYINNSLCSLNTTMGTQLLNTTDANCTITQTDADILTAWETASNRKVQIRGVFLDAKDSTIFDEINVTGVYAYVDATNESGLCNNSGARMTNDSWVAFTSGMCTTPYTDCWSNVTKRVNATVGANITWCFYANDSANAWNNSCSPPFNYSTTAGVVPTYVTLYESINCEDRIVKKISLKRVLFASVKIEERILTKKSLLRVLYANAEYNERILIKPSYFLFDNLEVEDRILKSITYSLYDKANMEDRILTKKNLYKVLCDSLEYEERILTKKNIFKTLYDSLEYDERMLKGISYSLYDNIEVRDRIIKGNTYALYDSINYNDRVLIKPSYYLFDNLEVEDRILKGNTYFLYDSLEYEERILQKKSLYITLSDYIVFNELIYKSYIPAVPIPAIIDWLKEIGKLWKMLLQ